MITASEEAQEVAALWADEWPDVEVAVVVFVRSRGADAADARDRAESAVRRQLRAHENGNLPTTQRGAPVPDARIRVLSAVELGQAAQNGYLRLHPTERAFR